MKIDLTDNDLREIHKALHQRVAELEKVATKLRSLGRENEAGNIDSTRADLKERLCTHIAAALGKE